MRLASSLLLGLLISFFPTIILAVSPLSLSNPGCPETCGNVTIPYPFGIGPTCSFNSSFAIICRNSKTPFLSSISMEVLNISMLGVVIVNQPVSPLSCSNEQRTQNLSLSLVGSPFTISAAYNSLAVFGCQVSVWLLANATTTVGGCRAFCAAQDSNVTSCNGVNCCQTTIPSRQQVLHYTYRRYMSNDTRSSCGYAFPVEKKWLQQDYNSPKGLRDGVNPFRQDLGFVPLVLEWELDDNGSTDSEQGNVCYYPSRRSSLGSSGYRDGDFICIPTDYYSLYGNQLNRPHGNFICIPTDYIYLYVNQLHGPQLNWPMLESYESLFRSSEPFSKDEYVSSEQYCSCGSGFQGNPYLIGGCEDINECDNAGSFACDSSDSSAHPPDNDNVYPPGPLISTRLKIALISIGSSLGGLILLVAFLLASWKSAKGIRNIIKAHRKYKFYKRNGGLLLEQQLSSTSNNKLERTRLFSSKELTQATDHYNENRILGRGGQGTVYKGMLTDGKIVAVKKSERVDKDDLEVFINEVVILSQINHRNVVRLLGCCLETQVPLLVYEFVQNGTLFEHIHDPDIEFPLSWELRLRVAREIARALCYLHYDASAPIFHRDIKSTNILLDEKYHAKVSDFGTSRSIAIDKTHLTTRVLGTFGYLDPEYFQSSQFTEKSDVYSFGVVVVELLTGEKAITSVRADEGKSLATHFLHSMDESRLFEVLDSRVLKEGDKEDIVVVAELARRCLHLNGRRRPTMKEVVVELEGIQTPKEEGPVLLQSHDDNTEDFESRDFSSFLGSMPNDTNTTFYSLEEHPMLDEP